MAESPSAPSTSESPHVNKDEVVSLNSYKLRSERIEVINSEDDDKLIEKFLIVMSIVLVMITFPLSLICIFFTVRQFERAVILRNGKVHKNKSFGPGLRFYLPCVDIVKFTDLRIICYAMPMQEALTKDSLTVTVDAVVYYKIVDPIWAVVNVANYKVATRFLASTTLRTAIGMSKFSDLLTQRSNVCQQVIQQMKQLTKEWGLRLIRFEIKAVCLPIQLQKAMAAEAESSRLSSAKIKVAKAEIESSRNLLQATALLMDNPFYMQLRYLQSLHMIAGEKTHTVVVPFSHETLNKIFQ